MSHIEQLFKAYPDVRREFLVKVEALRRGVGISGEAEEVVMARAWSKAWLIFSYDREESKTAMPKPQYFAFPNGGVCQFRFDPSSPYSIELSDNTLMFCENGQPVMEVDIPAAHPLFHRKLSDGTPLPSVIDHIIGDGVLISVLNVCFWEKHEKCGFCDMVSHAAARREKDPDFIIHKKPEQVAEAFELCVKEANVCHENITGGTIIKRYKGKTDGEFYLEYLQAISRRVEFPENYAIAIGAQSKETLEEIYATGIRKMAMNLEVWEPRLFAIICPGKSQLMGRDAWIQSLIDAVKIFGAGNVVSNFVSGVEMAQPYGFKDVDSALKSTLSGYEYLMSEGVVPRQDYWCIEEGSRLGGQLPPPSEFFIKLTIGCWELLQKYGLPPSPFFCRKCSVIDPIHDLY